MIRVFNFQCATTELEVKLEDSSTYFDYLQVEVNSPSNPSENVSEIPKIKTEEKNLKDGGNPFLDSKDQWAEDDSEPLATLKEIEAKNKMKKDEYKKQCCDSEEVSEKGDADKLEALKIPKVKKDASVAKIKIPKPPKIPKTKVAKSPKRDRVLKPQFIDCEVCGKSVQRRKFKLHMMVHNGEKPHLCDTCGKSFTWKFALVTHKRVHSGEKPYLCKHCGQSFRSSSRFTEHSTIHTGRRSYVCERCALAFRTSGRLKRHLRIHTGEKPYICSFCERGFSESYNLKQHRRLHTGEKPPHVCYLCTQAFIRKKMLVDHLRIRHGITQPTPEILLLGRQQQQLSTNVQQAQSEQDQAPEHVQHREVVNTLISCGDNEDNLISQSSAIELSFEEHKNYLKDITEYK